MRTSKEDNTIDAVADPDDIVEIDVQYDLAGGKKLYVNVNGKTILRIGRIELNALRLSGLIDQ